jgi:signal transduction histidine kinase
VTARHSFRSQLAIGSVLWTAGLLCVVSVIGVVFLAHNPRPHAAILGWFQTVPAGLTLAAGAACMLVGIIRIRRSLSMIDELGARLSAVQRGETQQILGTYPAEVQPLVNSLNALVAEREARVQRAITRAGDLAHGLKTPLSILSHDAARIADGGDSELAGSVHAQVDRMRRQIDYHLAHARASASAKRGGLHTAVAPSAEGLRRALERLHAERSLTLEIQVPGQHAVCCQREDFDEMLGNLLDNACKWCRARVRIESRLSDGVVTIIVDDDGPGIDETLMSAVLSRGFRADEQMPGSGLGLAIVRDLAELYEGTITLMGSPLGGLRAQLQLPSYQAP